MRSGIIGLDDYNDFLTMAEVTTATAEIAAACIKNQKLFTPPPPLAEALKTSRTALTWPPSEAAAAISGSSSRSSRKKGAFAPLGQANNLSANAGSCFKCGMSGHWSRDCTNVEGTGGGGGEAVGDVPKKSCPCG